MTRSHRFETGLAVLLVCCLALLTVVATHKPPRPPAAPLARMEALEERQTALEEAVGGEGGIAEQLEAYKQDTKLNTVALVAAEKAYAVLNDQLTQTADLIKSLQEAVER